MPIVILKFYRFIKYYFVVKIHISIVNVQFQYVAANGQGLLLCWNFIMSSPEPQPN